MTIDRRSLDAELTALKTSIRSRNNKIKGAKLRKFIPVIMIDKFYNIWKPSNIVVLSLKKQRYYCKKNYLSLCGKVF